MILGSNATHRSSRGNDVEIDFDINNRAGFEQSS